jgi:tRNA nucleotidyltransferase (CCA-adding enzyme)
MPKFTEETLIAWAKSPSDTEEAKLENASRMIGDCLKKSAVLSKLQYEVFGQGSYANDTNVKLNVNVQRTP